MRLFSANSRRFVGAVKNLTVDTVQVESRTFCFHFAFLTGSINWIVCSGSQQRCSCDGDVTQRANSHDWVSHCNWMILWCLVAFMTAGGSWQKAATGVCVNSADADVHMFIPLKNTFRLFQHSPPLSSLLNGRVEWAPRSFAATSERGITPHRTAALFPCCSCC